MTGHMLHILKHETLLLSRNTRVIASNLVALGLTAGILVVGIKSGSDVALTGVFATLIMVGALAPSFNIAVHALVGEKERGTMEPLLLLPVSPREILAGKLALALSAGALGIGIVLAAGPLAVAVWGDPGQYAHLINVVIILVATVVAPLTSAMCCLLVIVISGRSTNTQTATNVSMVVTLPLIFLLLGWMFGSIRVGVPHLALLTVVLLLLIGILFRLSPAALAPAVLIRGRG